MKTQEIPEEQKKALRKLKTGEVEERIRNLLLSKHTNEAVIRQFDSDVRLYNLYEAILYTETYEAQGYYLPGTTDKIIEIINDEFPIQNNA